MFKQFLYSTARRLIYPIRPLRRFLLQSLRNQDFNQIANDGATAIVNNGYEHIERAVSYVAFLNLPPHNIIADVGAATGKTAQLFAKYLPAGIIYAFEPIPEQFMQLEKINKEKKQIHTFNKALGSSPGSAKFYVMGNVTSSSLLHASEQVGHTWFESKLKEQQEIEVAVSTLDLEIPADATVNILKMDVQGFELEVLKGGVHTLKRTAIVLLELQNHEFYQGAPKYYELDAWLREHDFELYDLLPGIMQEKKLYEFDGIYINRSFLPA